MSSRVHDADPQHLDWARGMIVKGKAAAVRHCTPTRSDASFHLRRGPPRGALGPVRSCGTLRQTPSRLSPLALELTIYNAFSSSRGSGGRVVPPEAALGFTPGP